MTSEVNLRLRAVRDGLARARELRRTIRGAPDRQRRDAAIVAYSRTLDRLIDDLLMLDDLGLLNSCMRRLGADIDPEESDTST